MEKNYKINYRIIFYKDLNSISNYIKNELKNEIAANNLIDLVEKELIKRSKNPTIYESYESEKSRKEQYYKLVVKNYIIFYVVHDDTMEVRRMLYGKRNIDKLIY